MGPGDLAVLRDRKGRSWLIRLEDGGVFGHHRGEVRHEEIAAAGPGGTVRTGKAEPLRVGRPTLEEYVLLMSRAANVAYPKDAAAITMLLGLRPGQRVLEAGTGSGALTLHLAEAVGPSGQVHTVERRDAFSRRARKNVEGWGVANVRFEVGDLSDVELEPRSYDACALDMMEPWEVLDAVARAVVPGGGVAAVLPNLTQVTALAEEVRERSGFGLQRTLEVHHREWDVRPPIARPRFQQVGHTAFVTLLRRTAAGA